MRRVVLVFLFSVAVVVSRRPDVLVHPQFWAEDGTVWFADAYNLGIIEPFLHPAAGYFDTLPRLVALLGLLLPMTLVPLLFNCIAILFQVLPAQFLLSSRCEEWGSFKARALFAFLYLALPNSQELHGNISHAQWRLVLVVLMILFARPGRTALWNAFDFTMVALCALSGPFIVFIAPIAAVLYLPDLRNRWRRSLFLITGIGALIQATTVLVAGSQGRVAEAVRAATPQLLVQILAKQVFLAAIVGKRTLAAFTLEAGWGWVIAVLMVCGGIVIEGYVLLKGPPILKALIFYAFCIMAVSLAFPMTKSPQWPELLAAGGVRYWFFPMVAFIASVVWLVRRGNPAVLRRLAMALLIAMIFGIIQDWGHPRPVDFHFPDYARKFSELPSGASMSIPINPAGWSMQLMKR